MNIRGEKYECKTEVQAIEWMQEKVGKRVKRCVYPTRPELNYYITRDGIMFACRYFPIPDKYVVHQVPTQKLSKVDGIVYRMYSTEGEVSKVAARLVYCTWVLGYWSENTKVVFKDGDKYNICVENLELRQQKLTRYMAERMQQFKDIYRRSFRQIAHDIQWQLMIREDEAKDYTQDAFLKMIEKCSNEKEPYFVQQWVVMAQKMAMQSISERDKLKNIDDSLYEQGRMDVYQVSSLLDILKDKKQRKILEMVADGYSQLEISKIIGSTKKFVWYNLKKARTILKDYLQTDKEIMKIYAN